MTKHALPDFVIRDRKPRSLTRNRVGRVVFAAGFFVCLVAAWAASFLGGITGALVLACGSIICAGVLVLLEIERGGFVTLEVQGTPYSCTRCGYGGFRSREGRLIAGQCPRGINPCPLVPSE